MKRNEIIAISAGAGLIAAAIVLFLTRKKKSNEVPEPVAEAHGRHLTNVFAKAKKEMV